MKKTFTLLLLASVTYASAQSIHIYHDKVDVTGKAISIPAQKFTDIDVELALTNKTGAKITYLVSRTLKSKLETCAYVSFCTGMKCYGPWEDIVWTSPDSVEIKGNQTLPDPNIAGSFGIAAHYITCEDACNDMTVLYKVYNVLSGTKDTAEVTINYSCALGISEEKGLGSLSNAYPNPASNSFSVNYSMPVYTKSQIEVVDLYGKKVIEFPLQKNEGTATINTSALTPGVYFYTLIVGNQRTVTKRVVISE